MDSAMDTAVVYDIAAHRPELEAALAYGDGTHTYDDVRAMIERGDAQFWPGPASCIVTEVIGFPRRKILNLFLAGGKIDELHAMLPLVLAWGTAQGCDGARLAGRRGWGRTFLRHEGWAEAAVVYSSDLHSDLTKDAL